MAKMPSFPCMPAGCCNFFLQKRKKREREKRERRVRGVKVAVSLLAPAIPATAAERQEEEEESFLSNVFLVGDGRVALVASERGKGILQGQRRVCKKMRR